MLHFFLLTFFGLLNSCKSDENKTAQSSSRCQTSLQPNEYLVDLTARTWTFTPGNPPKHWINFSYDDKELSEINYEAYFRVMYCDSQYLAAIIVIRDTTKPKLASPVFDRQIEISERDYQILNSGVPVYFENAEHLK